ncbi:HAD hydrolase, family IA, variant 1 [Oesophagostomum dentatum]|uniref:HAD hydrolase, family IA, variant 1 n=1 Tax=Oesophagostomum dentatum TaxID=61180 RepID=A0A0B1T360_OESDE|nr:HAD hydrolase, family IA, variant 1 [Oesophagostomum dentatum]
MPIDQERGDKIARQLFDFYSTAEAWRIVDPEIKNVVAQLRQSGVGVAVLSNFDERLRKILQGLDLYELFDTVVLSGELGIEKPNPKMFEVVLTKHHLSDPSQLLHIGDNVKKDYQAAKDFGARAFLLDPLSVHESVPSEDRLIKFSELRFEL